MELSLENFKKLLLQRELHPEIQRETQQVFAMMPIEGRDYPLFVRIFEESGLVQCIAFFPFEIKKQTFPDVARLLHLFNKELDIPGFGLDEESKVLFFRCMIPSNKGKIEEDLFLAYLNTIHLACSSFTKPIEAVAAGAATFEELIEKVNKNQ
ncbi:MAG: YbjN domain-containing protein [Chlamydiales bacterium]